MVDETEVLAPSMARTARIWAGVLARHSAVRYLIIGGLSAAADFGLLVLLHGWLGVWLPLATLVAVVTAFLLNFALNRVWSFGSTAPIVRQFSRYLILGCGNWTFTVIGVAALSWLGLEYLVAKTVTLVLATTVNYLAYRVWVFADHRHGAHGPG
jgi:putative flippase GtrA